MFFYRGTNLPLKYILSAHPVPQIFFASLTFSKITEQTSKQCLLWSLIGNQAGFQELMSTWPHLLWTCRLLVIQNWKQPAYLYNGLCKTQELRYRIISKLIKQEVNGAKNLRMTFSPGSEHSFSPAPKHVQHVNGRVDKVLIDLLVSHWQSKS